jgi:hypothetical protein
MFKRIFAFLVLAFALFGIQCRAATCTGVGNIEVPASCTNTFSPTDTTGTYEFFHDGRLIVQFDAVLTTFTLTVTVDHTIDQLSPNEFPPGTVCVTYALNGGLCDEYDFSGNKSGPNGVPVKNIDYKRLITLTLRYQTFQTINLPAFAHAPGDNATAVYDVNFLTGYSTFPPSPGDPTMIGKLPGLSAVAAFDEPLTENDSFCFVSPMEGQPFHIGQEIEVTFRLTNGLDCHTGTPIRDKTASLSLSTMDTSGNTVFPPLRNKEEGNKFHWDHKNGVNEFDLSTEGLAPGTYTITVFGSKFSPQSVDVTLVP